jgi:hypothetical protein
LGKVSASANRVDDRGRPEDNFGGFDLTRLAICV